MYVYPKSGAWAFGSTGVHGTEPGRCGYGIVTTLDIADAMDRSRRSTGPRYWCIGTVIQYIIVLNNRPNHIGPKANRKETLGKSTM